MGNDAEFDAIVAEIEPPAAEGQEGEQPDPAAEGEQPPAEGEGGEGEHVDAAADGAPAEPPAAESPTAPEAPAAPAAPEPVAAASNPVVVNINPPATVHTGTPAPAGPSLPAIAARARQSTPARQVSGERRREPGPIRAKVEIVGPTTRADRRPRVVNMETVTAAFVEANRFYERTQDGMRVNVPVVHFDWDYPDPFDLRDVGGDAVAVTAAIDAQFAAGNEAFVAAGGICAPYPIDYGLQTLGETVRPVAGALPTFQATRGGVRWMDNYKLSDINVNIGAGSAVSQYTKQNDIDAVTKPCMTFTCKGELSAELYALLRCLQFGNWNARFYPEMIDQVTQLTMVAYARYAEMLLLQGIGSGSKSVHYLGADVGVNTGFTVNLLAAIERAVVAFRHRYRIPGFGAMRVALPDWVRGVVREDISKRMATGNDQFNIPDTFIDGLIRARGGDPWYFIDGENDVQGLYGDQLGGGADLNDWPSTVVFYVYPEGTWIRMDAGELDLGIVRDSTLNSKNNFQTFFEAWEGLMYRGFESYRVRAVVCPNGASAGTYSPPTCTS